MADEKNFISELIENTEQRISKILEKVIPKQRMYAPFIQKADVINNLPASLFGVMSLGGPPKGYFWYVRMLRVTNQTPATGTGGQASIYVGPNDYKQYPTLAACPITELRDNYTSLPAVQQYSNGAFRVGPQEQVSVVISQGTIATIYVASLEAYLFPDTDEAIEWVI